MGMAREEELRNGCGVLMWRETPYVVFTRDIGHMLITGKSKHMAPNWETDIHYSDDEGKTPGPCAVRLIWTGPDKMQKFAKHLLQAAEVWEKDHPQDG